MRVFGSTLTRSLTRALSTRSCFGLQSLEEEGLIVMVVPQTAATKVRLIY